jgi:cytochrome c-type biogenesis protein CcsB
MGLLLAGGACVAGLLGYMWMTLGRPPLRTMGETRLWFACFLSVIAVIVHFKFANRAVSVLILALASMICVKDLMDPGAFDRTMMPALRSSWFIPHVVAYMVSYSSLVLAGVCALYFLIAARLRKKELNPQQGEIVFNLVQIGFPLMTVGMLLGAFWAKEAWSDYWSWDPKETWALITWLAYAAYIHLYWRKRNNLRWQMIALVIATAALVICWMGVNFLPSAAQSIHVYGS